MGLSTIKQNTDVIIVQILSSLFPTPHYAVTKTDQKKTATTEIISGK
jgi:hypothetical protein